MPPPPPPPPPNAPPPPKVNTDGGVKRTGGGGDAGAGRGMLLSSIHQGAKLKKVVTNDRSSPQIGKINNGPSGGIESSPSAFKEGSSTGPPISGMFAGGMPKLRPAAEKGKPGGAVGTAILPPGRRSLPQTNEPNQSTTLSSNASLNVPPMTSSMALGSSAFSGQRLPAPSSVNSKPPPPPPSRDISYDQQKMGPASVQNESNSTMNLPNSSKGPLPPSTPSRSIAPTPQLSVRGQPPSLGNQPPPAPNRSAGPSSSSRVAPPPPPSRDSSSNRNLPPPPPVRGNVSLSQSEPLRRISSSSSISGSEISISLPPPPPVHRSSVINPPTYQRSPTGDDQQPPPPPPPRVNGNRASFPPPPVLSDSNIEARFQFLSDIPDPDPFRNIQKTYPSKAPRNTEKRSQGQVNLPNRSAPPPPPSGRGAPTPPPPPPNRR